MPKNPEILGTSMYCVKGEIEKLCMENNTSNGADVFVRAYTAYYGRPPSKTRQ